MEFLSSFNNTIIAPAWWQPLLIFLLLVTFKIAGKYLKVWLFLRRLKHKGAAIYFNFPIGIVKRTHLDTKKGDCFLFFKELAQKNPKARVVGTHLSADPAIYLIDPALIKDFLLDQSRYTKAKYYGPVFEVAGKGLIFGEGKIWKKQKRILSETFKFDFIISQISNLVKTTQENFAKKIDIDNRNICENVNILDIYQTITGESAYKMFFGSELDIQNLTVDGLPPIKFIEQLVNCISKNTGSPENILLGMTGVKLKLFQRNRDFFQKTARFRRFLHEIIQSKRKKLEEKNDDAITHHHDQRPGQQGEEEEQQQQHQRDFVTILLEYQTKNRGTDNEITDDEIAHAFLSMFIAGMDTTSHMLTMATYYFSRMEKDIQQIVLKEANQIAKAAITNNLTNELLNKSEIIHAFLNETLRMASPACIQFAREAIVDHHIEDFYIKKGTMVNAAYVSNNFSPEYYKDPHNFNLYRWIPDHPDFAHEALKNPYIFTPFSAGQRHCIGKNLGIMEGKITLSMFLATYDFSIPDDYKMNFRQKLVYGPRDTMYVNIQKKRNANIDE